MSRKTTNRAAGPPRWVLLGALGFALVAGLTLLLRLRPRPAPPVGSHVKLIDDFNDGTEVNLVGGSPFAQASPQARVSAALLRVKTPSPGELAAAISYDLPPNAGGAWGTGLNDLDISAARTLRFWLKAERLPLPNVRVEIVDAFGAVAQQELRLQPSTRWQRVELPISAFQAVSFNQLARFILRLAGGERPLAGTLYLDDLAFIGPPEVFFESLKDNLYDFPKPVFAKTDRLLQLPQREMLRAIASDTWGYFRDIVDRRHHLPLNYIQTHPTAMIGDYASTTDIGLYLLAVVSAHDLDFIDYASARERLEGTLKQLATLPTWHGHLYNYYSTTNLQVTRKYVSSVDNAWLTVGLVVVRQAFPELAKPATALIDRMDFKVFYDPANEQMRLGYDEDAHEFAPYHYGLLATEARIISAVAVGKGDVSKKHWFRVYRTLPKEWTWQQQAPRGEYKQYFGYDIFQGYYSYGEGEREVAFVPSWGGSLFEFLMPVLVLNEQRLAPLGLGLNDQRAVDVHIQYALKERGYPVWGLSPCATPNNRHGGYSEYGVAALGAKGYKDEAIVTPHVSFLSLPFATEAVVQNVRRFLSRYAMYGPYGLYDSVDAKTGDVAHRYLALDQAMSLVAITNFLNDGSIQRRFEQDPVMERVRPLLEAENFFENQTVIRPAE